MTKIEYDGVGSLDAAIASLGLCSKASNNTLSRLKKEALLALDIKMTSSLGGHSSKPIRLKVWEWLRDNKCKANVEPVPIDANDISVESVHEKPSEVIEPNFEIHDGVIEEPVHNLTPIEDVESVHIDIDVIADSTHPQDAEPVLKNFVEPVHTKPIDTSTVAPQYVWNTIAFNTTYGATKTRHVIKLEQYYVDALAQLGFVGKDVVKFLSDNVTDEWNKTIGDKSIAKMVKRSIVQTLLNNSKKP